MLSKNGNAPFSSINSSGPFLGGHAPLPGSLHLISLIILLLFYRTTVLLTRSEVVALVIGFLETPNDIDMSVLLMKCTLFWYAQLLPLKTGKKRTIVRDEATRHSGLGAKCTWRCSGLKSHHDYWQLNPPTNYGWYTRTLKMQTLNTILRIQKSDWLRDRAEFSDLLTTATVTTTPQVKLRI